MASEMDSAAIDRLLYETGAGVLSLSDGGETYAIPESFGYDGAVLYFQFVWDDDSRKMAFADTTDVATVTVFSERPARSVVVRGPLEAVPDDDEPIASTAIAENADIPTLDVVPDRAPAELDMGFYRLVPDERSGRRFPDPLRSEAES